MHKYLYLLGVTAGITILFIIGMFGVLLAFLYYTAICAISMSDDQNTQPRNIFGETASEQEHRLAQNYMEDDLEINR